MEGKEDGNPPVLALPSPDDAGSTDVNVSMADLGPIIINTDGTMSRIPNWKEMTGAHYSLIPFTFTIH